jgi:hypothetical protein
MSSSKERHIVMEKLLRVKLINFAKTRPLGLTGRTTLAMVESHKATNNPAIPEGLKEMAASTEYKPYKRVFTQMIYHFNICTYLEQLGEATLI